MFRGTLDDFTLPEILRMLAFSKKSGTLRVSREAGTGKIVFSTGAVVYAETELTSSRLGQKLVGAGKISPTQLRQSLDTQAGSGERLGKILLKTDAITKADLEEAVRAQLEEAAYELMCWEAGEFAWEPGDEELDPEVFLDIEELMADVEQRLAQQAEVQMRLSRADAVPRMVEQAPHGPGEINIQPEQWRVLVLVDGRRTVGELAVAAGVAEADVMRSLNDLAGAGLVEVLEPDAAQTPPAVEVSAGEGPDAAPAGTPAFGGAASEPEPQPVAAQSTTAAFAPAASQGTTGESVEPPEEWFEDPEAPEEGLSVAFPPPEPAVEDLPRVDRAAAVKELSGLFDEPKVASPKPPPPDPRRPDPKENGDGKTLRSRLTRRATP